MCPARGGKLRILLLNSLVRPNREENPSLPATKRTPLTDTPSAGPKYLGPIYYFLPITRKQQWHVFLNTQFEDSNYTNKLCSKKKTTLKPLRQDADAGINSGSKHKIIIA